MLIENIREVKKDKVFIRKLVMLAIPIAFQSLLNTLLNLVDTVMIGSLGESTIAAVGLANKVFFVFNLLLFGIVSGSSILTSQYFGKKDTKNIRRVLGLALILGLLGSSIFVVGGLFFPREVMRIFTPVEGTIEIGARYLRVIAVSYPITAITMCYTSVLRSTNRAKAPVFITIMAILVNVVLNYTFIFGHFGAPKMGVAGAALATVIARVVEISLILIVVYRKEIEASAKIKEMIDIDREFINKYFKNVYAVMINEFMWGLGVTMYALVYGRIGDEAVASITIAQNVEQLCIVLFQGLSTATAVVLGNELGANKLEKAEKHATFIFTMQIFLTAIIMVTCLFIRKPLINLFNVSGQVAQNVVYCLNVFIFYLPFRMFNFINIVGVLRCGGDTKIAMILDITAVWLVGIPLAVISGLFLDLPIYLVYLFVSFEEIYKFVLGFIRYKKKIWVKNIIEG